MTTRKTPARARTRALSPSAKTTPTQVFDDRGNHCLVAADGRRTRWAGYQQITMMDGWVGHTAYYGVREGVVQPREFCKMIAVTELVEPKTMSS